MDFGAKNWFCFCAIIVLMMFFSGDFCFASDHGKVRYGRYLDIEKLRAGHVFQKEDYLRKNMLLKSQHTYAYRYYPSCSVYYDTNRKLYYYLQDGCWKIFSFLPRNFSRQLGYYVKLNLDTDKPYVHHAEHVKKYPPGQLKNKHKNKHKWG